MPRSALLGQEDKGICCSFNDKGESNVKSRALREMGLCTGAQGFYHSCPTITEHHTPLSQSP